MFATLRELRRRSARQQAPTTEADTPAAAASVPTHSTAMEAGAAEEAQPATVVAETPEWEPHPAARATEDEDLPGTAPAETPVAAETADPSWAEPAVGQIEDEAWKEPSVGEAEEPALSDQIWGEPAASEPQEQAWAEPTPTAMGEAAARDDIASESDAGTQPEDVPITEPVDATADEEPLAAQAEPAPTGLPADMPDEEPFEHAGRWWFKRGAEILVYNEQTGEWVPTDVPAPTAEPSPAGFGPDATLTQAIHDISAAVQPEPETEEQPQATGQQGFWRCPSCGAVNGSTAATCRMCFAARP